MKKFVVAYINIADNELLQEFVEAEDAFHAALAYLQYETEATNLEEFQNLLWDSDEQINVLEVKSERASNWGPGMVGALPPFQFPTSAKL